MPTLKNIFYPTILLIILILPVGGQSYSSINYHQTKYTVADGLSHDQVLSITQDDFGKMWIGTYFGGVNYLPKKYNSFRLYNTNISNISGNRIREFCEDKYGNIWIGTEDAGLNKYDPANESFTAYTPDSKPNNINYHNIHGLEVDDDHLWIGTYSHGIDVMNIKTGKVIEQQYHFQKIENSLELER